MKLELKLMANIIITYSSLMI